MSKIRQLLRAAHALAYAEVKERATDIMQKHSNLTAFCMAMGTACFYDKTGPIEERHYTKALLAFIDEYDYALKLTGSPLQLHRDGGRIVFKTDW